MKLSVVIPVWNGERFLPACLDSLQAQRPGVIEQEIIVVDNASTDGSAQWVADRYPHVRLLRNTHNAGFAGGCNRGLRAATGDVLALLNQDAAVDPGWTDALAAALDDPAVDVAGSKILYPDRKTIQHAGGWIQWPLGLAHHYGAGEPDSGQWDQSRDVEFVTGAGLAFRRSVLERVGLLDDGFWPGYFEDADFCLRVAAGGQRIRYVAAARMVHQESASLVDPVQRAEAYERGRLRFLLKHLAPVRFVTEFTPAERSYQPGVIGARAHAALHVAYRAALLAAPDLLADRWAADQPTVDRVVECLQELARAAWDQEQAALVHELSLITGQAAAAGGLGAAGAAEPPLLASFQFTARTPLVGPLLRVVRTLWYNVAARWAVEYLRQQQEVINRRQAGQIHALRRQIDLLTTALTASAHHTHPPSPGAQHPPDEAS